MTRNAVLIFADRLTADLGRRRWSRRFAALLPLPALGGGGEWDVHLFSPGVRETPADPCRHRQIGRGFAERLEHAVRSLADAGYERLVVVGRDCPDLSRGDVRTAFEALEAGGDLVLGPDHGGGCWLIGLPAARRELLDGVRWCRGRDFRQLVGRAGGLAVTILATKLDLDGSADLGRLSQLCRNWRRVLAALLHPVPPAAPPLLTPARRAELRTLRRYQIPPPRGATRTRRPRGRRPLLR